ncbi:MAG: hypothetical protein NTY02_10095 [Acidobacteria bacterium]|nr:hypothetical protein [Acidobacteriota bacterium]
MGLLLSASGVFASDEMGSRGAISRTCRPQPVVAPAASQQRWERTEVVDATTGAEVRLTGSASAALQVQVSWPEIEFRKVIQANGDYNVRMRSRHDLVVMVRTGDRLRVTRNGRTATVSLAQTDEAGLDQAQEVLAGSRAVRAFRALEARLADETRESAPGIALETVDALLGILQGDTSILYRRRARLSGQLFRVASSGGNACFETYAIDVTASWDDLVRCIDEVSWFPGLQEGCALIWLLRVESSWFQFIGCSSIPLKLG